MKDISTFKMILKYLTGGVGGVVDYLLDLLNAALAKVDPANKAKIQAALNIAEKVLAALVALKWLCPTRWQTAYTETIEAVNCAIEALSDLQLTADELKRIQADFAEAIAAWKAPDDETCADCEDAA